MAQSANDKNIQWQHKKTTREQRETANKHKSGVIWLTGLPGSGKSTLAIELESTLQKRGCQTFILDGDNIRHGLNKDLGFTAQDRTENIRRIAEVAKLFMDAGFLIITAFISPYKEDRDFARSILPEGKFIETHIKASLNECERRDPKGHYKKARSGEIKDFTGISAPYEAPENPQITLNTETNPIPECIKQLTDYLIKHSFIQ